MRVEEKVPGGCLWLFTDTVLCTFFLFWKLTSVRDTLHLDISFVNWDLFCLDFCWAGLSNTVIFMTELKVTFWSKTISSYMKMLCQAAHVLSFWSLNSILNMRFEFFCIFIQRCGHASVSFDFHFWINCIWTMKQNPYFYFYENSEKTCCNLIITTASNTKDLKVFHDVSAVCGNCICEKYTCNRSVTECF